jgi:transcriptional regulator with GAF, ATPase, and Fis domain
MSCRRHGSETPRLKRRVLSVPVATMAAVEDWHWPGNLREFEKVAERAVIIWSGDTRGFPRFNPARPLPGRRPRRRRAR